MKQCNCPRSRRDALLWGKITLQGLHFQSHGQTSLVLLQDSMTIMSHKKVVLSNHSSTSLISHHLSDQLADISNCRPCVAPPAPEQHARIFAWISATATSLLVISAAASRPSASSTSASKITDRIWLPPLPVPNINPSSSPTTQSHRTSQT